MMLGAKKTATAKNKKKKIVLKKPWNWKNTKKRLKTTETIIVTDVFACFYIAWLQHFHSSLSRSPLSHSLTRSLHIALQWFHKCMHNKNLFLLPHLKHIQRFCNLIIDITDCMMYSWMHLRIIQLATTFCSS